MLLGWRAVLLGVGIARGPALFGWTFPAQVDGAGVSDSWLYLFAAAPNGGQHRGPAPDVRFTPGTFGDLERLGPGAWRVKLGVPAGPTEDLLVSARVPGTSARLDASVRRVLGAAPLDPTVPVYVHHEPDLEDDPRPARAGLRPLYFWLGVGAAGALLAAGLATRIVALDLSVEYNDPATTYERKVELQPRGEALTLSSSVLLGAGGAALLGTALLYYYTDFGGGGDPAPIRAAALPGGAAVVFSAAF